MPSFIRGYASSIYLFAAFIRDNKLEISFQPNAIFTTGDMLFSGQRKMIEEVFNTQVFDQYGLNDGGISAYECEEHCGMHMDTERAIFETVNEEGNQIVSQEGKILATSLYNYALPFIRYDTGDIGTISDSKCACGRKMALLKSFLGRSNDALKLGGFIVNDPGYGELLGNFDIEQFQIIQEDSNSITFRIIKGKTYNKENEKSIKKRMVDLLPKQVGKVNIKFDYVNSIPITKSGKYKFIINKFDQV
jgi:phenylacetate-CoA ligase